MTDNHVSSRADPGVCHLYEHLSPVLAPVACTGFCHLHWRLSPALASVTCTGVCHLYWCLVTHVSACSHACHVCAGVIWCMKFSKNGRYVATAGQDGVIRIWEVILQRGQPPNQHFTGGEPAANPDHDTSNGNHANGNQSNGGADSSGQQPDSSTMYEGYSSDCPVLKAQPYRVYQGHKQDVLELCWSKSQFVLSASMDKTVKLWHISMDECLRTFK